MEQPFGSPQPSPATPPPSTAGQVGPDEERQWALFAHLSALAGFVVPLGNLIGPLVLWILAKDKGPFAAHHAREALNFQIGVAIVLVVVGVVTIVSMALAFLIFPIFVMIAGVFALVMVGVSALILAVVAAVQANKGEWYRYPFSMRFVS